MTDINTLPELYKDFLLNKFYKDDFKQIMNKEDITIMFNLHNNFINVGVYETGKSCSPCVKRVYNKIIELTQDSYYKIIESINIDDIII